MRNPIPFGAMAMILMAVFAARASTATDAMIAEAGAALDAGNVEHAQRLADGALREPGLTSLQRGRLLLDRGLANELKGQHDEAMADFTAALQTHALPVEERAQALLQRGFLLDGMNRLNDAVQDYSAVIALKTPSLATALNNRANVYRRQGRLLEARRDYQAALGAGTTKPQYPYFGLGQIAEAGKDKDSARNFYAKALAADPGYQLAAQRLADLGGPRDATLAEPDVITLHPPGSKPAASSPTPLSSPRITLRPPPSRRAKPPSLALRPALDGPTADRGLEVQLGAWRSEPEAQAGWEKAKAKAGNALEGRVAHIVRAEIPGRGTYFRLRVATPAPSALCASLRSAGQDCTPAPN